VTNPEPTINEHSTQPSATLRHGGKLASALPTDPASRIVTLDVLRGVAVLGILLINVYGLAFPDFAMRYQPFVFGSTLPIDRWTWAVEQVFVEGAMRALFSLLFGAGLVLLTQRLDARPGVRTAATHYRRTAWLIVFGLLHAYVLLWNGDVLYIYGMVGLALYPLRTLSPRWLIIAALLCFAVPVGTNAFEEYHLAQREAVVDDALAQQAQGEPLTDAQKDAVASWNAEAEAHRATDEKIERELQWRRAGYMTVLRELAPRNLRQQTTAFLRWDLWDAAGPMLLGMALMKLGVLSGMCSTGLYGALTLVAYGIGLSVNMAETFVEYRNALGDALPIGFTYYTYDLGRVMTMLGHVGVIVLLVRSGVWMKLQHALGACGRMALTNYMAQSVICGLLFYGFGFGLVGRLGRFDCLIVVAGIWAIQLLWSSLWLAHFRYGPVEWLWRTLTYWQRVPMRKS